MRGHILHTGPPSAPGLVEVLDIISFLDDYMTENRILNLMIGYPGSDYSLIE